MHGGQRLCCFLCSASGPRHVTLQGSIKGIQTNHLKSKKRRETEGQRQSTNKVLFKRGIGADQGLSHLPFAWAPVQVMHRGIRTLVEACPGMAHINIGRRRPLRCAPAHLLCDLLRCLRPTPSACGAACGTPTHPHRTHSLCCALPAAPPCPLQASAGWCGWRACGRCCAAGA